MRPSPTRALHQRWHDLQGGVAERGDDGERAASHVIIARSPFGIAVSRIARTTNGGTSAEQRGDEDGHQEQGDRARGTGGRTPRSGAAWRRDSVAPGDGVGVPMAHRRGGPSAWLRGYEANSPEVSPTLRRHGDDVRRSGLSAPRRRARADGRRVRIGQRCVDRLGPTPTSAAPTTDDRRDRGPDHGRAEHRRPDDRRTDGRIRRAPTASTTDGCRRRSPGRSRRSTGRTIDEHVRRRRTLEVPVDYDDPDGANVRRCSSSATSPTTRTNKIGSLLVNPGGPGFGRQRVRRCSPT